MTSKISSLLPWGISALAGLILAFAWTTSRNDSSPDIHDDDDHEHHDFVSLTPEQIDAASIRIDTVAPQELAEIISGPAKLQIHADKIAHVYPKVDGITKEVKKNIGETVKSLELLALLESREAADLKAGYLNALNTEEKATALYKQEQALHDKKLSTLQEYQSSHEAAAAATLAVKIARQNLYTLGLTTSEINQLPYADASTLHFYEVRTYCRHDFKPPTWNWNAS